jgi:hypothetical protein
VTCSIQSGPDRLGPLCLRTPPRVGRFHRDYPHLGGERFRRAPRHPDVLRAVADDPDLTARQRVVLAEIYTSFRDATRAGRGGDRATEIRSAEA